MTTRPTDEDIRSLIDGLRSPAYWFSGSSAGHEGENERPLQAAKMLAAWLAERQAARAGVTDEMVHRAIAAQMKRVAEGNCTAFDSMHAALQSMAPPITSISDALNFLEAWALSGGKLHGDDIQQFHATVERIAPAVRVPDEPVWWQVKPLLEWALGTIDELNDGPMTADQWAEDVGLYQQARAMLSTSPQPQQAVPDGYIELNMSNYNEDDVSQLNDWAIRAHAILSASPQTKTCGTCDGEGWVYAGAIPGDPDRTQSCPECKPQQAVPDVFVMQWHDGEPPFPWSEEWFIAETTYGDRVVLRALPEDYAYDYKTADETYIKAETIKRWMQFPDSEFVAAPAYNGKKVG